MPRYIKFSRFWHCIYCNINIYMFIYIKVLKMSFNCDKCEKIFQREEHLNRHLNRKIPCDREISCPRCCA